MFTDCLLTPACSASSVWLNSLCGGKSSSASMIFDALSFWVSANHPDGYFSLRFDFSLSDMCICLYYFVLKLLY